MGGTTIAGIIYKDGVVLGADTRATEGPIVADKNCQKIHYIAPNIYCCGAGTAADTQQVTDTIASQLQLHRMATGRDSRVPTALDAQANAVQVPRPRQRCTRFGGGRLQRALHLHRLPTW